MESVIEGGPALNQLRVNVGYQPLKPLLIGVKIYENI